jgi:membrane protease YdiL (CAAX protease family)
MVLVSILMTWIYQHTDRSTLSAALVHFSGNLCGALLPKANRVAALEVVFLSIAAVVALDWRRRAPVDDSQGSRP